MLAPLIQAVSISQRAAAILRPGATGRVLASFTYACDLVCDDGAVAALVWGSIGDGPMHVVLERGPDAAVAAGTAFTVAEGGGDGNLCLVLGEAAPLVVEISGARLWEPDVNWEMLRSRRDRIAAATTAVRARLANNPTGRAFLWLPDGSFPPEERELIPVRRVAAALCRAHERGDEAGLAAAVTALCGLGPGLTPAGDDWLAGWLLGLRRCPTGSASSTTRSDERRSTAGTSDTLPGRSWQTSFLALIRQDQA